MKAKYIIISLLSIISTSALQSCLESDNETIYIENGNPLGIPSDDSADPNPKVTGTNTNIPNGTYVVNEEDGYYYLRIDLTGVQNPNDFEFLRLYGTGSPQQNCWVEVDGVPKGIDIYNNEDDSDKIIYNDFVFLIDNSGSMDDEADAIASSILSWSKSLSASKLDVKFACVGYDGEITGAMDFGSGTDLSEFLNYSSGTYRTRHFDTNKLSNSSGSYYVSGWQDECGVAALRYATDLFSFRKNANRIFVNFTDESNYTAGSSMNSVEYVRSKNWDTSMGTIHTVWSENADTTNINLSSKYEKPWRMSQYTGGTIMLAPSDFRGVTLDNLPVTGAMQHSYIIRFTNIDDLMDGKYHEVHITVQTPDKKVRADKTLLIKFEKPSSSSKNNK